jgi:pimeloyl-ACP methyl ester carboxylesterase
MTEHYVDTNGIRLHYLDSGGPGAVILLMHGLTANAHAFDGLMAAGLGKAGRVLSIDLRGRGESAQPEDDYSMNAHARDILGLMDALGVRSAITGGHSFGALLSFKLAAEHPERVERLIIIDAALRLHEDTREMLGPALGRLGKTFPSFDTYLQQVKAAPYMQFWDEHMRSYYRADVREQEDASVIPIPQLDHIMEAVNGVLAEPWAAMIPGIGQETLLINGPEIYTMNAPLLPEAYALETVETMRQARYAKVPGNHHTMLYGAGAVSTVQAILDFLKAEK